MPHPPESIAIVLCTCNGAAHLDAQLDTLRQQDGVTEIIVNDDVSTDATMDILARHAAQDGRIRFERNPSRLGVTANFERAIRRVSAPWVALSDQDDLWVPGKLARMQAAWDGQSGLMHHASHKFRGREPPALPLRAGDRRKFSGRDLRRLLFRNSVVGHTVLARTDVACALLPFPAKVPHDWWLGVGATRRGGVQYLDEYLVHYRIHAGNAYHAAGSRWRRLRGEHALRIHLLEALGRRIALDESERAFVRNYLQLLRQAERRWFSLSLWQFYRQEAQFLFGPSCAVSWFRAQRKSFSATLGSVPGRSIRRGLDQPEGRMAWAADGR